MRTVEEDYLGEEIIKICPTCGKEAEDREYAVSNEHLETVICPNCRDIISYEMLIRKRVK